MKVFVSWSGDAAKQVAEALQAWVPKVLPAAELWISPQIGAGAEGVHEVMDSIRRSHAGIVVLTPQSQVSPWVLFESGAFAFDNRFVPYVVGLWPHEVAKPFRDFQFRNATRADTLRLIEDLLERAPENEGSTLSAGEARSRFETVWPELDSVLTAANELSRASTRELQYGAAAALINQAERDAAEQRLRAEQQERRATLLHALIQGFLRLEGFAAEGQSSRVSEYLGHEIARVREILSRPDFGRIDEAPYWGPAPPR